MISFLIALLTFIGVLASASALVLTVIMMLRCPPLLVAVLLACWVLSRVLKKINKPILNCSQSNKNH
nr:hypothetical protein [Pseudomonas sp. WS 5059]